ncbi:hypothetical protein TCDM_10398 [Trypanosoma cruzi Dm28c]|uniref:Uncharacterized protein n=1 Tax=Trypanosoma cruzi Dm28c TaxID=1416333 RepID=V5B7H9_TRYCR|nr:hypothetical protein TCDM_10398 [Trypanosoma cruzi Dm28c]
MAYSTQLTIPAMHAHIKATESIILTLSLSTGSRTPPPHTPTHDSSGCRHSEHTTHPPAQTPHPHHQIHLQESQQPSRTRASSSSTRAQGPTRRLTVIIAVIVTRSGVAGASQLIGQAEEKECNKRERDGAQRIERESADNMKRGQQAQPHSSQTTRRHPRKEGTQHQQPHTMQEEKTSTTISSQLISTAPGKWPKDAATTHTIAQNAINERGPTTGKETRGAPHPQESRRGLCTPSPPFSSWPRKKTTAATRNCQHALQKKHSNPLQCASCVCVCACRNTKQRSIKEGAEYVEGRTN